MNGENDRQGLRAAHTAPESTPPGDDGDVLTAAAAHDLRSPVRAIRTLAEWIEEDDATQLSGESKEHLALITARARRLEGLLNGLVAYLDCAAPSAKRPTDVALGPVLERLRVQLEPEHPPSRVSIQPGLPSVRWNLDDAQRVLRELLRNALTFAAQPGGRVDVGFAIENDTLTLSISDNGKGIAPAHREAVFDPFRVLQSRDEREAAGMGLTIARKLARQAGGDVRVSDSPEGGARLLLTLPVGR